MVNELIGRVADKWTMLVLEVLGERGELRFTRLGERNYSPASRMLRRFA